MKNYTQMQRAAWALLLITGAVKPEELEEKLDIKQDRSKKWIRIFLQGNVSIKQVYSIMAGDFDDIDANLFLATALIKGQ